MKKIFWTADAEESFNEILEYSMEKFGESRTQKLYEKIISKIDLLSSVSLKSKLSQDLKDIGINNIYELVESPWRIFYKIQNDKVIILLILDGRRNVEEVLISKVIDRKV
jgi:plasmid stabilization system protein ParE